MFDLPRGAVFPVSTLEIAVDPAPHPFALANASEIRGNWQRETAEKPALFDGEIVLFSRLVYEGRRLSGRCHVVRYSDFLYWRRVRPQATAEHAYAHAMPVTQDGALVAARMASRTANAGLVYFAAGSFEPEDFSCGMIDIDANMLREVREETGIALAGRQCEAVLHALSLVTGTVICRRYRMDETADELAEKIARFVAAEEHPEIVGPVIIRSAADRPDRLADHMPTLLDWHFSNPPVWG